MHTDGWHVSVVYSLSVVDDPVLIVLYENKLELKSIQVDVIGRATEKIVILSAIELLKYNWITSSQ